MTEKEMETVFVTDEEIEVYEEPKKKSRSGLGVLAAVAAVAGGVLLYRHCTKDKREQKNIKKLRKKGYVIYGPDEVDELDIDVE